MIRVVLSAIHTYYNINMIITKHIEYLLCGSHQKNRCKQNRPNFRAVSEI
jgi:hypothetical protein